MITLDVCLRLLAHGRRRRLLRRLCRDGDEAKTVTDLADSLLADERTASREDVVASLHHRHLPKLETHGIVEYDARSETIRYRGDDRLEAVLEVLPREPPKADERSGLS